MSHEKKRRSPILGQWLKNCALASLFCGFALELSGGILDNWDLFRAGLFFFLIGMPLLFIGIFLGRPKG